MSCGDFALYREYWIQGQFLDAVFCPHTDQLGMAVFALLVFGSVGLGLYIYTDSIAVPLVLSIVAGSIVIAELPPSAVTFAGIALILAITAAGYLVIRRLDTR